MMGLLDPTNDPTEDPRTMGLLSLGMGLLNSRGSFGNALGQAGPQALQAMRQVKDDQARRKHQEQLQAMQAIQMQQAQMQMAEMQRQQQEAEAQRGRDDAFRSQLPAPTGATLAQGQTPFGGFGITDAPDPQQQLLHQALLQRQIKPMEYLAAIQKDKTPIKLGKDDRLLDPTTRQVLVDAMPDPAKLPAAVQEYEYAKGQGYKGTFEQFQTAQKRAGATNVSVSMDKGFGDAFATDAAKMLATSRDKAQGSARTLQTLDRINTALNSGSIVSGPTATPEMLIRQIGQGLGVAGKSNEETLKRTRDVIQGAAALAVDGAAMLAGQGQITDGERALVGKAAGGNVTELTVPEIKQLTGTLRKINTLQVQQHQDRLKNVDPKFAPFVPFYKVEMPKSEPIDFGSLK